MIWDAARVASRRPLRKQRKFHGPVGLAENNAVADNDIVCRSCGYLWCSCKWVAPPYGETVGGIPIHYNPFMRRGRAIADARPGIDIQCGLLRLAELERLKFFVLESEAVLHIIEQV